MLVDPSLRAMITPARTSSVPKRRETSYPNGGRSFGSLVDDHLTEKQQ
jgi:hypothetical protein